MNESRDRSDLLARWGTGAVSSLGAFLLTLVLHRFVGETYLTLFVAAVALSCWRKGWQAGAASTAVGVPAVTLLVPPLFSFRVDSTADLVNIVIFAVTGVLVCASAFALDRRSRQLRVAERRRCDSEGWLQNAQRVTRFWNWEIGPDTGLMMWANPYGELPSLECAPLEQVVAQIHPADRERFRAAVEAANRTGELCLEFRVMDHEEERRLFAKGSMHLDPDTGIRRLIGVTVEADRLSGREAGEPALEVVDDLLEELEHTAKLDRKGKLTVALARNVIGRLVAAGTTLTPIH